jgi:hypothetical protein
VYVTCRSVVSVSRIHKDISDLDVVLHVLLPLLPSRNISGHTTFRVLNNIAFPAIYQKKHKRTASPIDLMATTTPWNLETTVLNDLTFHTRRDVLQLSTLVTSKRNAEPSSTSSGTSSASNRSRQQQSRGVSMMAKLMRTRNSTLFLLPVIFASILLSVFRGASEHLQRVLSHETGTAACHAYESGRHYVRIETENSIVDQVFCECGRVVCTGILPCHLTR